MKGIKSACRFLQRLVCLAAGLLMALQIPRIFGVTPGYVRSASMMPAIPVGALVYVAPVPEKQWKAGDVVSYQAGGRTVIHRIEEINREERTLRTRGDAVQDADFLTVAFSQVNGKVLCVLPYAGFAMVWVEKHRLPVCIFFVCILVLPNLAKRADF